MSVTYLREKSSMKNEYLYNSDLVKNNNNFKMKLLMKIKKLLLLVHVLLELMKKYIQLQKN